MFDRFFDSHVNFIKCLLLAAAAMMALCLYLLDKYPALKGYEKNIRRGLVTTAVISVFAYLNMGLLHYDGGFFHGYDFFHRYMTSKYFKEVGYLYLPDAAIIADSEDKKFLQGITEIKDQRDFIPHPAAEAFLHQDKWRGNFDDRRWREFKEDLRYFEFKGDFAKTYTGRKINLNWWNWRDILGDEGYSETPVFHAFGYILTNILLVTNIVTMLLMSFSDVILIGLMAYFIARSFNIYAAAFFTILLCCTSAPVFSWVGNSLLQMDWLFLLVLAVCYMKENEDFKAGAFSGAAACVRPFTMAFAIPPLLKVIHSYWKDKKFDRDSAKFIAGFFAGIAVLGLFSLLVLPDALAAYRVYFERMAIIIHRMDTAHIGFRSLFLWDGEVTDALPSGWQQNKTARLESYIPVMIIMDIAVTFGLFIIQRKISKVENFLLGGILVFLLMPVSKIYYIFTALFALFFALRLQERAKLTGLSALLALNSGMYVLASFQNTDLLLNFIYSLGLFGIIIYIIYSAEKTPDVISA